MPSKSEWFPLQRDDPAADLAAALGPRFKFRDNQPVFVISDMTGEIINGRILAIYPHRGECRVHFAERDLTVPLLCLFPNRKAAESAQMRYRLADIASELEDFAELEKTRGLTEGLIRVRDQLQEEQSELRFKLGMRNRA